jgi:hypothetical protein
VRDGRAFGAADVQARSSAENIGALCTWGRHDDVTLYPEVADAALLRSALPLSSNCHIEWRLVRRRLVGTTPGILCRGSGSRNGLNSRKGELERDSDAAVDRLLAPPSGLEAPLADRRDSCVVELLPARVGNRNFADAPIGEHRDQELDAGLAVGSQSFRRVRGLGRQNDSWW